MNEYPENSPDARIQRAEIYDNEIKIGNIQDCQLAGLDYLILGPLFNREEFFGALLRGSPLLRQA